MRRVLADSGWPPSWCTSYDYDLQEVYGQITNPGYSHAYRHRQSITLELLASAVPAGSRVLDVAAAQGNFSLLLAEAGYDVTWNDLRAELADYVKLKHEFGRLQFAPGNAFELEFPQLFDAVLVTEIIEHVAHPDDFLRKTAALVRPGGHVIMTTPNGRYFRNTLPKFSECADPARYEAVQFRPNADGHVFLLHPDEIAPLAARAGLRVDRLMFATTPLTAGYLKSNRVLRLLPTSVVDAQEYASRYIPRPICEHLHVQLAVRFEKI